jgi:hypothetical protein
MFFYILLIFVLIEQFFYFFPSIYPYEYGILVKKIEIDNSIQLFSVGTTKHRFKNLLIKCTSENNIYIRYKYPFFRGGPFLFVGMIKNNDTNIMRIRVGFFSSFLLFYFLFASFHPLGLITIASCLCIFATIYFSFMRFIRAVNNVVKLVESEKGK